MTFVDFHKIVHHHGIGLQNSPLFFCTWYNFSDLFGFGGGDCYSGEGIGVSTIITSISSMGIGVGSMSIGISSMGIASMGIGSMGIGVSTIEVVVVGGSDGYRGNSWGGNNLKKWILTL